MLPELVKKYKDYYVIGSKCGSGGFMCINGGTCNTRRNGCVCPAGYTGDRCQLQIGMNSNIYDLKFFHKVQLHV